MSWNPALDPDCPTGNPDDILGHDKPTKSYGVYSGGSCMEQKREVDLRLNYGIA